MRNWGTMLESRGRIEKTVYHEKKSRYIVCISCEQFFYFFMVLGGYMLYILLPIRWWCMSPNKVRCLLKLFLSKTDSLIRDYNFLWLNRTLACKIAASNSHIFWKYTSILTKKPFAKKKLPTIFCTTLFPEIFTIF